MQKAGLMRVTAEAAEDNHAQVTHSLHTISVALHGLVALLVQPKERHFVPWQASQEYTKVKTSANNKHRKQVKITVLLLLKA